MICKTGVIAGTGAAISVALGFVPKVIRLINLTTYITADWNDQMALGYIVSKTPAGVATYITGGVTPLGAASSLAVSASASTTDGDTTTFTGVKGFSLGVAAINTSGNSIAYEAWGESENAS
jgi:hypothetical protein